MHGNIVSAVSQVLTPDMVARVASAAGISDRATAQTAVAAAVPAILSSLANLAAKPDGERRLADAMAKQSPRTLENLASASNGPAQLADTGKSLLSSLLGAGSFTSLASAIGKFAGLGDGPGTLAPRHARSGHPRRTRTPSRGRREWTVAVALLPARRHCRRHARRPVRRPARRGSHRDRWRGSRPLHRDLPPKTSYRQRRPRVGLACVRTVVELGLLGLAAPRARGPCLVFLGQRAVEPAGHGRLRRQRRRSARRPAPICSRKSPLPSTRLAVRCKASRIGRRRRTRCRSCNKPPASSTA